MSKKYIYKDSQADWQRIASMQDEDIYASDISVEIFLSHKTFWCDWFRIYPDAAIYQLSIPLRAKTPF